MLDPKKIKDTLCQLSTMEGGSQVFGVLGHQYRLKDPLTEAQMRDLEEQIGVRLPKDYRRFLLEVGAGGAGPFYGVFPLSKMGDCWSWSGDGAEMTQTSRLHEPWPHQGEWNLEGHEIWDQCPEEDEMEEEEFDEAYEDWQERFFDIYWADEHTIGGICISHQGCALRSWLVVSGPARGQIWSDGRVDEWGLVPTLREGKVMLFGDWYHRWLELALEEARGEEVRWMSEL